MPIGGGVLIRGIEGERNCEKMGTGAAYRMDKKS